MVDQGNYKNLTITWFDKNGAGGAWVTSKDITSEVTTLPLFTDTGSGEVNECELTVSAAFGKFINDNGDETPFEQFDRIRIQIDDLDGNSYDHYFEIANTIVPTKNKAAGGLLLTLSPIGIEHHVMQVHFSGMFWFADAFEVARKIGEVYVANAKPEQPVLTQHTLGYNKTTGVGNEMPKWTVNHYEYGMHEDFCYNRWMDMLDKLGGSVSSGGILDFFEIGFETSGVNAIQLALFLSGDRSRDRDDDANHVTIKQTESINVGETEGGISAETGTVVAAWGSQKDGSIPTGHSIYVSGVQQFIFRPLWDTSITYMTGAKIKYFSQHYVSKADGNQGNTPPVTTSVHDENSFWNQIDMADEFGDTVQYSEWTDDKIGEWADCCADANATSIVSEVATGSGAGMWDGNLVILDNREGEGYFRTWVDVKAVNDTQLQLAADNYAYSGQLNLFPIGFRVLVNGTGIQTFVGNDSNNIPFSNNIVEWDGDEWLVKYRPAELGTELDEMQVAVIDEMKMYFINSSHVWAEQTGDLATDCFHAYKTLSAVDGWDIKPAETDSAKHPEVTQTGGIFAKNIKSAIESVFEISTNIADRVTGGSNSPTGSYYKKGAWLCFRFPFSPANYVVGVTVGNVYGTATPAAGKDNLEPSFFETQNMTYTSRGERGFSKPTSQDFGQGQSLAFFMRIKNKTISGASRDGESRIRCTMYDQYDNVVTQDFAAPFEDVWYPFDLPLSGFSPYRARKPRFFELSGNSIANLIHPKELEEYNTFAYRRIKLISFEVLDFYDEYFRYAPEVAGQETSFPVNNTSLAKTMGGTFSMAIDDFHFTKPLLAIASAADSTNRAMETEFLQRTHIMTYDQLLNDAKTQVELERFQHVQYDIRTSGKKMFDIKFGDTFFLEDEQLVNFTDDTTVGETTKKKIKLVAKRIEYSLTSPTTGVGGLTRRIIGSRRFT